MTEKPRYEWEDLRTWRVVGLVALIFVPVWPLVTVVLVELFDFPRSMHSGVGVPLLVVMSAVRQVTSFKCPECGRSFARHERTGTHLTNTRCAHCGLAVGT